MTKTVMMPRELDDVTALAIAQSFLMHVREPDDEGFGHPMIPRTLFIQEIYRKAVALLGE